MTSMREKTFENFSKILEPKMAKNLEIVIFNWSLEQASSKCIQAVWKNELFRRIYRTKALSLHFNLTNPKNTKLLDRVLQGEIKVRELVKMTHQEMYPDLWADILEKQFLKDFGASMAKEQVPEGLVMCGKCKSKRVHWEMHQTRAADESSTCFCLCSECGNRWRFNA